MASVSRARERGQLLLVGALALAVSLVAIALILNSAIYTHNLASRYDSPAEEAVTFARDARLGAGGTMTYVNERFAEDGWSTVKSEYVDGLADVEAGVTRDLAVNGRIVRVEHVSGSATRGVRIADDEAGGSTFEPATPSGLVGSDTDWTVAPDVRVRKYDMRVDESFLGEITSDGDVESLLDDPTGLNTGFVIEFDDGTDEWLVALYDDGTGTVNLMVHEDGTTKYQTCTTTTATATIEFTESEVNGKYCRPLSFVHDLSGTYTIRYYNSDKAGGSYELTADRTVDNTLSNSAGPFTDVVDDINYGEHCSGPTYHGGASDDYPRVSPALYSTEVRTVFDGPRVTFEGTQRVAPEEVSPPPGTPRVLSWSVSEADTLLNAGKYDLSWDVMDPDGADSAVDVTIEVVEPDGETKTFSGGTGDGSATVDTDDESGIYTIRLIVDDGPDDSVVDGNSRRVVQRHDDDGDETGCPP